MLSSRARRYLIKSLAGLAYRDNGSMVGIQSEMLIGNFVDYDFPYYIEKVDHQSDRHAYPFLG